jgi:tetraacyldisaccharide 4'-kinase
VSPLNAIFAAVVTTRNQLYDRGILRSRRLTGPVISVGNLSVGGSGKTPFVILLGELLNERGISFDVLSRGYRRRTRGVLLVDPGGAAQDFGDEPLLIAGRLRCPVIVGHSRYQAGVFAEKTFGPQLHILDDGFQHRGLARDFDIVMLTAEDLRGQLLPWGRLREPLAALRRADAVVLSEAIDPGAIPVTDKPIWRVERSIRIADPPLNPVVFCSIARPQRFFEHLAGSGIRPVAQRIFRDHHAFSDADVRELIRLKDQHQAGGFITTEKDLINLGPKRRQLGSVSVAQVLMRIRDPAAVLDTVRRVLADGRRQP